jgi:sigma-E factor negative regulatory protein RseB
MKLRERRMSDSRGLLSGPRSLLIFGLLYFLSSALSLATEDPRSWLERMGESVEYLNYRGTLVHINGTAAGILEIVHRVENDQITEKITALDGSPREIIRNNDEVTCILPDQEAVLVERRDDRDRTKSPLRGRLPDPAAFDEAHYELEFIGAGRAAGRDAKIIAVRPRDDYRYGYRLWLDRETAMPLKSQLWDRQGNVIEQIVFAQIELGASISADEVKPSLSTQGYIWHRSAAAGQSESSAAKTAPLWRAIDLPAGFMLIAAVSKYSPGAELPMEQLVYTDGLASVSVFIEIGVAASEQAEGLSRLGAANAYTTTMEGQLVTAVGEVPARTVEMIALSMRPDASQF